MADKKIQGRKQAAVAGAASDARDSVKRDTERYEALAREHGADLSEEGFNEALRKVGQTKTR